MPPLKPVPVSFIGQAPRAFDMDAYLARYPEIVPCRVSYKDETEDPAFSEDGVQHFEVRVGTFAGPEAAADGARAFLLRHLAALQEFTREEGHSTVHFDAGSAIVEIGMAANRRMGLANVVPGINLGLSFSLVDHDEDGETESERRFGSERA